MEWKRQHNRPTSSGETTIPHGGADQPPTFGGETPPPAAPECRELPKSEKWWRGLGKSALQQSESHTNTQPLNETSDVAHEPVDETEEIEEGPEMNKSFPTLEDLAEDEDLHTLEYDVKLDPAVEVPVSIKIPGDLWESLTDGPKSVRDVPDYYTREIEAHRRLNAYLDHVWFSLNQENVALVAESESISSEELVKRARRSVTRIQFEIMDRIEGLKEIRKRSLWGQDCLYTIATPFA